MAEIKRVSSLLAALSNKPQVDDCKARDAMKASEAKLQDTLRMVSLQHWTGLSKKDILQKTWENFEPKEEIASVINNLRSWEPSGGPGYFLFGQPGTGKTHMLKALINEHASENFICSFVRMSSFVQGIYDALKEGYMRDHMNRYMRCKLLVMDDLGTEKNSDFIDSEFFTFIEKIMDSGVTVFMTSNLTGEELKSRYHPRILDRFKEMMVPMTVNGKSHRQEIMNRRLQLLKTK